MEEEEAKKEESMEVPIVRAGFKEFRNNKGYYFKEEWKEAIDGEILMERLTDDGLGKKKTENYKAKRDADGMLFEVSDDIIEDIANY